MSDTSRLPVSASRVDSCLDSSNFWAKALQDYAAEIRARADRWVWVSVTCSTLTGLGVWSTLATSTEWLAVLPVSVVAFLSAFAAAAPRIGRYEETARAAAQLATKYGSSVGDLMDAREALSDPKVERQTQAATVSAIKVFESIKADKDALMPRSKKLRTRLDALEREEATHGGSKGPSETG